jgi:hypothetical protein
VKTWAMRGTLHLLPAAEYAIWQAALAAYPQFTSPVWLRNGYGLSEAQLERLVQAVAEALDGRALTREELAAEIARRTRSRRLGEVARASWGSTLKPAAFRGLLCFAPSAGTNVRFTRPDAWLGARAAADPDDAWREVTRRYLAAYGPATGEDLARWWGLSATAARRRLEALGDEVVAVELEGKPALLLARDAGEIAGATPPRAARLLPAFDPYVVAASLHVERLMPGPHRARVYRNQGWISPVLLVAGRMDGTWTAGRVGRRVVVEVSPFVKLAAWARRSAEEEAQRLAAFMGAALELRWGRER